MTETLWTHLDGSIIPRAAAQRFADAYFDGPRKLGPIAGAYNTGGGGHWTFGLIDGTARYELTCDKGGTWTVKRYRED